MATGVKETMGMFGTSKVIASNIFRIQYKKESCKSECKNIYNAKNIFILLCIKNIKAGSIDMEGANPNPNVPFLENTEEDDEHFCIKCKTTITGLQTYIYHRKNGCTKTAETVSILF